MYWTMQQQRQHQTSDINLPIVIRSGEKHLLVCGRLVNFGLDRVWSKDRSCVRSLDPDGTVNTVAGYGSLEHEPRLNFSSCTDKNIQESTVIMELPNFPAFQVFFLTVSVCHCSHNVLCLIFKSFECNDSRIRKLTLEQWTSTKEGLLVFNDTGQTAMRVQEHSWRHTPGP